MLNWLRMWAELSGSAERSRWNFVGEWSIFYLKAGEVVLSRSSLAPISLATWICGMHKSMEKSSVPSNVIKTVTLKINGRYCVLIDGDGRSSQNISQRKLMGHTSVGLLFLSGICVPTHSRAWARSWVGRFLIWVWSGAAWNGFEGMSGRRKQLSERGVGHLTAQLRCHTLLIKK